MEVFGIVLRMPEVFALCARRDFVCLYFLYDIRVVELRLGGLEGRKFGQVFGGASGRFLGFRSLVDRGSGKSFSRCSLAERFGD